MVFFYNQIIFKDNNFNKHSFVVKNCVKREIFNDSLPRYKCGSCVSVDKTAKAICCRVIEAVENLLGEEGVNCITAHSRFRSYCLHMHSVRFAIEIYSQYVEPFDGAQPPHE